MTESRFNRSDERDDARGAVSQYEEYQYDNQDQFEAMNLNITEESKHQRSSNSRDHDPGLNRDLVSITTHPHHGQHSAFIDNSESNLAAGVSDLQSVNDEDDHDNHEYTRNDPSGYTDSQQDQSLDETGPRSISINQG